MTSKRLEIVVLLREVRDPRPPVRLMVDGAAVADRGVRRAVNPADLAALDVAVTLAERGAGSVTAVAVGGESLDDALRLALSMGAARAVRIWDGAMEEGDAVASSRVLSRALEILQPALFFTGTRLLDCGDDPSPALAAARLGLPFVSAATSIDVQTERADVVRKAAKGARQRVSARLPCAVLFDAAAAEPRYPDLDQVLRSLAAKLERWGIEDLGLPPSKLGFDGAVLRPAGFSFPRNQPLRVTTPDPTLPAHERVRALFSGGIKPRAGRMHFGTAQETAERVVEILAEEGLLPGGPRGW